MIARFAVAAAFAAGAFAQSHTMTQGAHRMEIMLERLDGEKWRTIDPGLVLASGDRVRFRFRTNFDGYLYVTNSAHRASTSSYSRGRRPDRTTGSRPPRNTRFPPPLRRSRSPARLDSRRCTGWSARRA